MKVALYGPPAAGKTKVGSALASRLGVPFVDTDSLVERRAGMRVAEIFARHGEAAFRAIEVEVCSEVAASPGGIVMALGGGSLLDRRARAAVERSAVVVCLDAGVADLVQRLGNDGLRPLVAGPDQRRRLEDLLRERRSHYESFPSRVDTSGRSVGQVAAATARLVAGHVLRVHRPECAQTIELRYSALEELEGMLRERGLAGPLVLLTDENVNRALGPRLPQSMPRIVIPPGEEQKTFASVERLCGGERLASLMTPACAGGPSVSPGGRRPGSRSGSETTCNLRLPFRLFLAEGDMSTRQRWSRALAVVGLVALLVGAIDPLEGSVVIAAGAGVLAFAAWLGRSRHRKLLYLAFAAVAVGVAVMWGMSSIGGLGGRTGRSMWWALLLLPYPAGWIMGLVGAVRRLREVPAPPEPAVA